MGNGLRGQEARRPLGSSYVARVSRERARTQVEGVKGMRGQLGWEQILKKPKRLGELEERDESRIKPRLERHCGSIS